MAATEDFQGLFVPLVTPFDTTGAIDEASLENLARHQLSLGIAGLVSCARIGEGPVLSWQEKQRVYEVVGAAARATGHLHIATIMPQSTDEAVRMTRELQALPVDAVMIFPPLLLAWGKVGGDLKVKFFEDVAKETDLPLVLFQVPVSSYWYDAETVSRIATIDNVVAYKEASFNVLLFTETMRQLQRQDREISVLTGNDRFVAESYMLGAQGALIGIANLATERWVELDRLGRAGDHRRAAEVQDELTELKEIVFAEPIVEAVSRIKTILESEGLIATNVVRRPQMGISEEERAELLSSYHRLLQHRL